MARAAICKAIEKLQTFRGEAALLTWLCTFCRHELSAYLRRHDNQTPVALVEDEPEIRAALESLRASVFEDPGRSLERTRVAALVRQVLGSLPAHYATWTTPTCRTAASASDRAGAGAAPGTGGSTDTAAAAASHTARTDAGSRWTSRAGEALLLAPGRAPVVRRTVTSGAEWDWVTAVAPPFRLEGSTLPAFLDWVTREQGWRWAFVDDSTRQRAAGILLHGSTDGMRPSETIAPVLAASGMSVTRDGDRLLVAFAR